MKSGCVAAWVSQRHFARVKSVEHLSYPRLVPELDQAIDLEEVVRVLVSLGIEESCARAQFEGAGSSAELLSEAAALAVESDAASLIPNDMALPVALFELVDGLRQAGLPLSIRKSAQAELVLVFGGARPLAYELDIDPGASTRDLVRGVAYVLPRTHQLLIATAYERDDVLPVLILDRGTYMWFSAAVGDGSLDHVFARAGSETTAVRLRVCETDLIPPDWRERFAWHAPAQDSAPLEAAFERVRAYDPRVPWPSERTRPPGDDFYEYCNALAGAPLAECLASGDSSALAQLLFRFALATLVGANCDVLAARRNPGLPAQGLLGWGQLTWAFFIFDALGASAEAERAGRLLEETWVCAQERGTVAARQRAYYDLARFLRTGERGAALNRLSELVALRERAAWQDADSVTAALLVHTEPLADQLTHHALYHVWPAPMYALARRAGALELLPKENPFLSQPLLYSQLNQQDPVLIRLREQLQGFDALDPEHLPALLDPLPVIVDVEITSVEGDDVHGHTLLAAHDDAEHRVVAPRGGREMRPGDIWLLEVRGSKRSTAAIEAAGLGLVKSAIALPTGEWIEKV